jgi:hypothetical protein
VTNQGAGVIIGLVQVCGYLIKGYPETNRR